ncbi:hypothetical protein D3C75_643560 [compost metagenome]
MPVQADDGSLRGEVDDASASLFDHVPGASLGNEETGLEVNVQRGVPSAFTDVQRLVQQGDASAVDQKIKTTELFGGLVNRSTYLIELTQVDGQAQMPGAEACGHFGHRWVSIQQGDLGAALDQQAGAGQTDSGSTAGDHGAAAVKVERLVPEIGHCIYSMRAGSGPGSQVKQTLIWCR